MILSCGEALIDMLPRTSTQGEAAFAPYAGGAGVHTPLPLGRACPPPALLFGGFPATPGGHCRSCAFATSCPASPRGGQVLR